MLFETLTEVVDPEPHAASLNMAIDEVLLREAGGPLLRVYRWLRPAVSFGYFGKFGEVERAWPGRESVRRWTGGGIVPHGDDFTYTLVVPAGHPFAGIAARESYREIHGQIAALLVGAGCEASVEEVSRAKVSEACFENAVEFDVVARGAKIAGAAQRRTRWGLLHQGSIQLAGLNADFARALAAKLAPVILQRQPTADQMASARDLAARKYGAKSWIERF